MREKIKSKLSPFLQKFLVYLKRCLSRIQPKRTVVSTEEILKTNRRFQKELPKNPYLQSKVLWNDMYGSLQARLENSYRIIFILSVVIAIALIGFIIVAGETKVKPYVTVIHGDEVLTLNQTPTQSLQGMQPKLALFFTKKFIRDARIVSADGDMNALNKVSSYSFTSHEAVAVLKSFYAKNNPDVIARHSVVDISITSVLRESPHSLVIRWTEAWRSVRTGKLQKMKKYIAQITYQYKKPSENSEILKTNPLGFYITYLSWSKDQGV